MPFSFITVTFAIRNQKNGIPNERFKFEIIQIVSEKYTIVFLILKESKNDSYSKIIKL